MKKLTLLLVVAFLVVGCATHQAALQPDRSPLWRAQMAYTGASLDYEAVMLTMQELRAAGKITDAQWKHLDAMQTVVQSYARVAHGLLETWEQSGEKPATYDDTFNRLTAGVAEVKKIVYEVKP